MQINNSPSRSAGQPARLEVVVSNRKTNKFSGGVVGLNHDVKKRVMKIMLDSDFDITSLLQVARIAGIKGADGNPQRKVREILREAFYEQQQPPSGPSAAAWPQRRMAA